MMRSCSLLFPSRSKPRHPEAPINPVKEYFVKYTVPSWPFILLFLLLTGCATLTAPDPEARHFSETLDRYPAATQPLSIRELTAVSAESFPRSPGPHHVFIMVHPAYSLFFREANRSKYTESKYSLLAKQFETEADFIAHAAREGSYLVLIIPRNYQSESVAPLSYISYINELTQGRENVLYLFSESSSNGSVLTSDLVELYRFLEIVKAQKVLIGGGFIGRCEREFYDQFTGFFERGSAFIVPEISTISPDDVTEAEAGLILEGISNKDYSAVRDFIEKKLDKPTNILSLPIETGL